MSTSISTTLRKYQKSCFHEEFSWEKGQIRDESSTSLSILGHCVLFQQLVPTVFEYCKYTKENKRNFNESQKGAGISDNGLLFMERDTSRVDLLCNLSKHNLQIISIFVQCYFVIKVFLSY